MPGAIIDSCCLIDVLASGHAESVLRACGHTWHMPVAVQGEVQFIRQPDPADSSKFIMVPVDLSGMISAGVLTPCKPDVEGEFDLFTQYAALFGSDGEAMCLALAENRGWLIATDDKQAISIGQGAGLTVVSSPELLKLWADTLAIKEAVVAKALTDIEIYARFRPNQTMPECQWWLDQCQWWLDRTGS